IANGGLKAKLSDDQSPKGLPQPNQTDSRGLIAVRRGSAEGKAVLMSNFAQILSQQLRRPVIDKTGLTGLYDIRLQWTPELESAQMVGIPQPPAPGNESSTSIFTALQEQLGLKLESGRAPVDVLVIDHAEKPEPN